MSAFLFVAASGCFLGLNFLYFVWDILGLVQSAKPTFDGDVTGPGETARQIIVFIFIQGLSLGMLLCYWRFPAQESRIVEDSELEQPRIDRTALVLSEIQMSNRGKGSRFIERLSIKSPVEADSTPCMRRQNTQVSYSELEAESDWNTDGKQGRSEGVDSRLIVEADSTHVINK